MIEEAMRYHSLGLCVIPIKQGKKQPACRSWSQYQSQRPTEKQLRRWFAKEKNLAVVCGPVSNGLVVRDFDDMTAYNQWATDNPHYAQTLPTVETGRPGRHVYCRADIATVTDASGTGATILDMGNGELRAGGYCLLPSSIHPTGVRYRWQNPIESALPEVDLIAAGFLKPSNETESNRALQTTTEDNRSQVAGERGERKRSALYESAQTPINQLQHDRQVGHTEDEQRIESAILESLPQQPGQRNRLVFELARGLKAVPSLFDAEARDLREYVRRWHQLALPVIGTQPFEETWIDFIRAWPRVKYPKGSEPVMQIFERAQSEALPHEIAQYQYSQSELIILVAFCRELQRSAGRNPFFLSCRTAGKLIGKPHLTIWRWLSLMEHDGLLEVVEKGSQKSRKATRFRYRGSLAY